MVKLESTAKSDRDLKSLSSDSSLCLNTEFNQLSLPETPHYFTQNKAVPMGYLNSW